MKTIFKKSIRFLGIAVFIYIISRLDWGIFVNIIRDISIFSLLPIYLLIIPKDFAATYRWHALLNGFSIKRSYFNNISLYFTGLLAGFITPGRVGEFYRIFRLEKEGHSKLKTSFIVFLLRFFDLSLIFILSVFGIIYFLGSIQIVNESMFYNMALTGISFIIIFFLFLFVFKSKTSKYLSVLMNKLFKTETKEKDIIDALKNVNILLFLKLLTFTVVIWSIHFYQIYLFAGILNIDVPFLGIMYTLIISTLVATLPVTFMGLGTREIALIKLFSLYSVSVEKVVALSLLIYTIMITESLISMFFWNAEHKNINYK